MIQFFFIRQRINILKYKRCPNAIPFNIYIYIYKSKKKGGEINRDFKELIFDSSIVFFSHKKVMNFSFQITFSY